MEEELWRFGDIMDIQCWARQFNNFSCPKEVGTMFVITMSQAHCFWMCFCMKNNVNFDYACHAHAPVLVRRVSNGMLHMPRYKKKIRFMSMPAELYMLQFSFRPCPEVISESAYLPSIGLDQFWGVLYFWKEPLVPVLKNKLELSQFQILQINGTMIPGLVLQDKKLVVVSGSENQIWLWYDSY